jgi:ATP-dependent 26S proteasome regulatory subunit
MNGCSGAELKGVCTEAGMYALRERRVHVTQEDFGEHSTFFLCPDLAHRNLVSSTC